MIILFGAIIFSFAFTFPAVLLLNSRGNSCIRGVAAALGALLGGAMGYYFLIVSNYERLIDCHNDQCMAIGIFMNVVFILMTLVAAIANLFLFGRSIAKSRKGLFIIIGAVALICSLIYGVLQLTYNPLKSQERAQKDAAIANQEYYDLQRSEGTDQPCELVLNDERSRGADMEDCRKKIESYGLKNPKDAYLGWYELRKFRGDKGFAVWGDGRSKVPESHQRWFLTEYFQNWMKADYFLQDVDKGEVTKALESILAGWSRENVAAFFRDMEPELRANLKAANRSQIPEDLSRKLKNLPAHD